MEKTAREFNVGDNVLCKDGLTTLRHLKSTEIETYEEGERYLVVEVNELKNAYEYVIIGDTKYGMKFYQFFSTIDPNLYSIYEFFYSAPQERKMKLLKINSTVEPTEENQKNYWQIP